MMRIPNLNSPFYISHHPIFVSLFPSSTYHTVFVFGSLLKYYLNALDMLIDAKLYVVF